MNTFVIIDGIELTNSDLAFLNSNNENSIVFDTTNPKNFLPDAIIPVIIELSRNLSYSAIYDMIKFILIKLYGFFEEKSKDKETKIEIICNGKETTLKCNFNLTKKQKEKIIDAAIQKLLDD